MFVRNAHIHKKSFFRYVRNKIKTKEDESLLQEEKNELIVGNGKKEECHKSYFTSVFYLGGN